MLVCKESVDTVGQGPEYACIECAHKFGESQAWWVVMATVRQGGLDQIR